MDERPCINSRWKQIRKVAYGANFKFGQIICVKQLGRSEPGRHQTLKVSGKLATLVILQLMIVISILGYSVMVTHKTLTLVL